MSIAPEILRAHGLTVEDYEKIERLLGREPNDTEIGIFSVMWSEHCSYKSSRIHLKKLPTQGPGVLQGPGENAGVIDIGDGLAAVFKIESHNHPSFIEPYQGAATGVGGIIRDIFTMGARPIALMNSLHFGDLRNPRTQAIMEGVVAGIGGYGNCMGIPTVGGEVHFEERYGANPLVNAFCLGIASADGIFLGTASGAGNPVIYVGAKTGRDGIHGATMASEEFNEDSEAKRPTVQVGDPFLEKLLLEACLEAMQSGAVVGIQDMGAAGLTCSTTEMAGRAGMGIRVDLDRVPQREPGMSPYEIMLSESQERMLLVVERGREEEIAAIFERWDLDAVVVGEVTESGRLEVFRGAQSVARIPNRCLTDEAPLYDRPARRPSYLDDLPTWEDMKIEEPQDYSRTLIDLVRSPHLAGRRWVYRQYDSNVRTNTVWGPGADCAVVRLKQGSGGLAMSLDSNARFSYLNPRLGAELAVAECCRNLACAGSKPLGATNCLNFASPENPEIMWQFIETVEGMATACRAFEVPVTGGNVSFYNETNGVGILPTPVIGIVGKVDNLAKLRGPDFRRRGDLIYLIGETRQDMAGSVYLATRRQGHAGPCPRLDFDAERKLHRILREIIGLQLVSSIHDLSEGGLAMAVVECCLAGDIGCSLNIQSDLRLDEFLFSETPSRVLVSIAPDREEDFLEAVSSALVTLVGRVGGEDIEIRSDGGPGLSCPLRELRQAWEGGFDEVFRC